MEELKNDLQVRATDLKEGKVKFNVKNVHIAVKQTDAVGAITYGKPFALPGCVSISLEAKGELTPFYADGIKYYVAASNAGYEGEAEFAYITDEYREQILKEMKDKNGVMFESVNAETVEFAIMFEIEGDQRSTRFVFYNCTSTRPTVDSKTVEDKKEPGTEKLTISCASTPDGIIRAKTTPEVQQTIYDEWYKEVYSQNKEVTDAKETSN